MAALESALIIFKQGFNDSLDLSEQQIIDCSWNYGNSGCEGGIMDEAYNYLYSYLAMTEAAYPFLGQDGWSCNYNARFGVASVPSYELFRVTDPAALVPYVKTQPVTVAISGSSSVFQLYSSGIITSPACGTTLDHAVTIIGYGTENGVDYWIIKNQWGVDWGENGYARIERTSGAGTCGLNQYIVIPNLS